MKNNIKIFKNCFPDDSKTPNRRSPKNSWDINENNYKRACRAKGEFFTSSSCNQSSEEISPHTDRLKNINVFNIEQKLYSVTNNIEPLFFSERTSTRQKKGVKDNLKGTILEFSKKNSFDLTKNKRKKYEKYEKHKISNKIKKKKNVEVIYQKNKFKKLQKIIFGKINGSDSNILKTRDILRKKTFKTTGSKSNQYANPIDKKKTQSNRYIFWSLKGNNLINQIDYIRYLRAISKQVFNYLPKNPIWEKNKKF